MGLLSTFARKVRVFNDKVIRPLVKRLKGEAIEYNDENIRPHYKEMKDHWKKD
jgi:hypothetical protein